MTLPAIPALSEDGWVTNPIKIADLLFSYFFTSEYSQTYLFNNKIASLPYIMQNTQGDLNKLSGDVANWLKLLFSNYFNNIVVESGTEQDPKNPNKYQLTILVQFTDNAGKTYSLGKLLEINDLIVQKIITQNNG